MRLLIIGSEHAGKSTLAAGVSRWMIESMGLRFVRWHDHFVVPRLDRHTIVHAEGDATSVGKDSYDLNTDEDEEQIISLRPSVLEQLQRHNIWRHLHPDIFRDDDTLFIGYYYADAVYAPVYYGYGERGSFADRLARAREWDAELLERAHDAVLVLVRAAPGTIKERLASGPRVRGVLRQADVEHVVDRFDEEFDASLIRRKFTLDTTQSNVEETLDQFLSAIRPYLSSIDTQRMSKAG